MLDIQRVLNQDRLLRALIGLNRKAFDELLDSFSPLYEQSRSSQPRQRAVDGGRKARLLSTQEKLFFILFYFKCYPTFDLAGIIFDLHRSQAHEWMHRLQPILEETLGKQLVQNCTNFGFSAGFGDPKHESRKLVVTFLIA